MRVTRHDGRSRMSQHSISSSRRTQLKRLNFKQHYSIALTIATIAASQYVSEYVIGYTSRQGLLRREGYKSRGYDHLVILADRLTRAEALRLEEAMQSYILECKVYAEYKKYDPQRRGKRYYPSAGQAKSDPHAHLHSVYMAWREGSDED